MVVGKTFLNQIHREAKQQQREQQEKERASVYWVRCPTCARKVARKQILMEGCWVCGWVGTELELVSAKHTSEQKGKMINKTSYKTKCPQCSRLVVTEELEEKGCYICGWRKVI